MKGIILPGEVTEAECSRCDGFVPATYNYGDLELSSGVRVSKVMRATCDRCGEVLEVAQQSAHRIREARQKSTVKLNFRLPQPLRDYAESTAVAIGSDSRGSVEFLIRAALLAAGRSAANHEILVECLRSLKDPVLELDADAPDSVVLTADLHGEIQQLVSELRGVSRSEVLRRLLVASAELQIVQRELRSGTLSKAGRQVATAAAC